MEKFVSTNEKAEKARTAALLADPRRPWYVRALVWTAVAAVCAGGAFWWYSSRTAGPQVQYVTQKAVRGDLDVTVSADGTLNPMRTVTLGSELSGIVRKVNVDVNDEIKTGQVLIELDTRNLEASVASAKASLSSAEAKLAESQATLHEAQVRYNRLKELNKLPRARCRLERSRSARGHSRDCAGISAVRESVD